jgi:anti-anti-sigma factor
MEFKSAPDGDRLVIHLTGMLTFDDHETFRSVVTSIVDSEAANVVMDLSGLSMIDSAGIGMLLLANDRAAKLNKQMRLRGVTGHVAKVVELSKIEQLIPID